MSRQRRWRGAVGATIALVVAGLVDGNGVVLLGAVIPLAFVAVGALSRVDPPTEAELQVTRTVTPTPAPPGRPVTVTLTVTNESERSFTDVRIVDGVPDALAVLEGSPRAGSTLESGATITREYVVVARRGEYAFDPPQLRCRGLGASAAATVTLTPDGDESLVCRLDADAPPIEETGQQRIGQLTTDRPGDGLSFHSSREYQPTDPASRINWRQYAKRGELATVTYERQVAASVIVVVDARPPNRVVAGRGRPTGVELAAYAATQTLTALLAEGHEVGVAIVGRDGDGPAGLHWLAPGRGREQRSHTLERLRLATEGPPPSDSRGWTSSKAGANPASDESWRARAQYRKLIELAPANAQLALFTPALDDVPIEGVEDWRGAGLPVVVLTPDIVPENTTSGQCAQIERRTRLARAQAAGARTFDWRRGTPLPLLIDRAFAADAKLAGRLGGAPSGRESDGGPLTNPPAGGER